MLVSEFYEGVVVIPAAGLWYIGRVSTQLQACLCACYLLHGKAIVITAMAN